MAGRDEQETSVSKGRLDDYVEIWTNNVVDARALEKESRAKRTNPTWGEPPRREAELLAIWMEEGFGVTYRISADDFHPLKGFRRKSKPLTDEQKADLAARLRSSRS